MSLNLLAVQDEITAKLRELAQDVYETSVPDDSKLRFDTNGTILPYIVIEYSDLYRSNLAGGIISTRYDVGLAYAVVSCIGPTERSARQVAELVRDKLTGFIPNDAGELVSSGGSIAYTQENVKPSRYVSELGFTFPMNTVW